MPCTISPSSQRLLTSAVRLAPRAALPGWSHHDIHLQWLFLTMQVDMLLQLKPHLAIDDQIDIVRALEIAVFAVRIRLCKVSDHKN
jgi:hypothetical protein